MEAFQLRLWDGRIGRWLSPDPYGQYASPYLGMGNNPIGLVDPDGGRTASPDDFYENNITHEVTWIDGTAEIDGYTRLGASYSFSGLDGVTQWGESRFGDVVMWNKDWHNGRGGLYYPLANTLEISRGGSVGDSGFNIESAVNHLNEFALDKSKGKCALYVRQALDAGGVTGLRGHATSYYMSGKLEDRNFEVVSQNINDTDLESGDIAVFLKTKKKPYGHIAMYNGEKWVSDFKQKSFFVHAEYIKSNTYAIYRIHHINK
jgi:hypothetical protein